VLPLWECMACTMKTESKERLVTVCTSCTILSPAVRNDAHFAVCALSGVLLCSLCDGVFKMSADLLTASLNCWGDTWCVRGSVGATRGVSGDGFLLTVWGSVGATRGVSGDGFLLTVWGSVGATRGVCGGVLGRHVVCAGECWGDTRCVRGSVGATRGVCGDGFLLTVCLIYISMISVSLSPR
jgi:hypothetical protein